MKKKKQKFMLSMVFILTVAVSVETSMVTKAEKLIVIERNSTDTQNFNQLNHPTTESDELQDGEEIKMTKADKQVLAVLPYIEKAEKSQSGEDVYLAKILSEKVPDSHKFDLLQRIAKIEVKTDKNEASLVKLADDAVNLAEKHMKDEDILKDAQEKVVALSISEERTALVERLHVIYQFLLKEKEKSKQN